MGTLMNVSPPSQSSKSRMLGLNERVNPAAAAFPKEAVLVERGSERNHFIEENKLFDCYIVAPGICVCCISQFACMLSMQ